MTTNKTTTSIASICRWLDQLGAKNLGPELSKRAVSIWDMPIWEGIPCYQLGQVDSGSECIRLDYMEGRTGEGAWINFLHDEAGTVTGCNSYGSEQSDWSLAGWYGPNRMFSVPESPEELTSVLKSCGVYLASRQYEQEVTTCQIIPLRRHAGS